MDTNTHIREYLKHYIDLKFAPGYAVALTGGWGAGKTYFAKKTLQELLPNEKDYIYISLYGLNSNDDVDTAIFREAYPALGNKGVKIAGGLAKAAMTYFRLDIKLDRSELINLPKPKIYIFDDLERCRIPLDIIMGYLNEFIERHNSKVLIIVNEKEIQDLQNYQRKKEKVIGKSLEVKSDFDSALKDFTFKISDQETLECIKENIELISEVYQNSNLNNLRVFQQTLWDFERLYSSLADDHKENENAIKNIIQVFFSLSLEFKSGRIGADDIAKRQIAISSLIFDGEEAKYNVFTEARNRYKSFDITDSILSDDVLIDILEKGYFDRDKLHKCISASPHFGYLNEKSWKIVWHAATTSDSQFYKALSDMELKFSRREYVERSEILHIFGIRLWAARVNILSSSISNIKEELISYIDDLYTSNKIEPLLQPTSRQHDYESAEGLGFRERDTSEYKEVFEHFESVSLKKGVETTKELAQKALALVPSKIFEFSSYITNRNGLEPMGRIPFLHNLKVTDVTDKLLTIGPMEFEYAMRAIASRYDDCYLQNQLKTEKTWFLELVSDLNSRALNSAPLNAYRIRRAVEGFLNPVVDSINCQND